MNNKKAKQLRKEAKLITDNPTTYMPYERVRYSSNFPFHKLNMGTPCKLNPNCTRAVYKKLKKEQDM